MIRAEHVTIAGDVSLANARIVVTQKKQNLPNYFEDAQMVIHANEGSYLLPSYQVTVIRINSHQKKFSKNICRSVKRIALAGNLVFGPPCYLLDPLKSKEAGVPQIFKPYDQFVFACKDGLHVTTDFNVYLIEL